MEKLSKENIQFIETYLNNSQIHFEDVKIELIDHVATAIEVRMNDGDQRDFYDIFKDYMVEHKAELMKRGGKSWDWDIFRSVSMQFVKSLIHWKVILGSILSFFVLDQVYSLSYLESISQVILPMVLLVIVGFIPIVIFGKRKFSFIGNFMVLLSILFFLNYYTMPFLVKPSFLYTANLIFLSVTFAGGVKTTLDLVSYYKNRLLAFS